MKHCPNRECPDRLTNGFAGEYRDEIEVCPYCGTPLEQGPATGDMGSGERPVLEGVEDALEGTLVRVGHYLDPSQAELARGFLESRGIPARIARDAAGGARPDIGGITGIRLMVPASLKDEALRALEEAEG